MADPKQLARLLGNHLANIPTHFNIYNTNAHLNGINSKI